MTWSARITKADGTTGDDGKGGQFYQACQGCKHGQVDAEKRTVPCYLPKVSGVVGSLLTSVDVDANGHMASGSADLKCNGFEPKPEPEVVDA